MKQPTRTTEPIPAPDFRRPAVMAALALADHLVSAGVPVPASLTIEAPLAPGGEALVKAMAHRDLDALHAWQAAFGGEITHQLFGDNQVYSTLIGRAYDGPFQIWTLRSITDAQQVAERQMCAAWCEVHGDPADWAEGIRLTYADLVLRYRLEVAK